MSLELLVPGAAQLDLAPALASYQAQGYARLGDGPLITEDALAAMRARADQIMLGEITYDGLFFQRDSNTGRYQDLPYGKGWEGPSLAYRKIEKLEKDPLFLAMLTNPLFERVARALIPGEVAIYRAILMNKPAEGGSELPWHQDGGRFWGLDEDPYLQVWTALDDAPTDGGCLEVVPGSHVAGLATPAGGIVPPRMTGDVRAKPLPARAGQILLLHNHVWHRSGPSCTGHPRRAFSVCYMSAATRCLRKRHAPRRFFVAFPEIS